MIFSLYMPTTRLADKRNNEIIHSEILSYDAEDNVLSDGKSHFEYDALGRLTKATEKGGSIREYSYDAYGNRASLTENGNTVTYLYDEANQLLSTSSGLSFKYDRRGNVIEKSLNGEVLNTYIYGANNRLERVVNAKGNMASYSYNGLGRRVSRRADNTEIEYILDQTKMYNNLLEADGDSFVWDENNLLFRNRETEIRDRLGSPIDMGEFGTETAASTLGFTGYMYDDISGTYFAQAREYMPEIGRFAGRDIVKGTVLQPLTLNNYHYCYSNPNKFVDWDGRAATVIGPIQLWPRVVDEVGEWHYNRNNIQNEYIDNYKGGSEQLITDIQSGSNGWEMLSSNDPTDDTYWKGNYHRHVDSSQGDEALYNVKYVKKNKDGSSYEIVLCELPNGDCYIVDDPVNMGTYNYSNPDGIIGSAMHFVKDMLPYYYYKNTPSDEAQSLI